MVVAGVGFGATAPRSSTREEGQGARMLQIPVDRESRCALVRGGIVDLFVGGQSKPTSGSQEGESCESTSAGPQSRALARRPTPTPRMTQTIPTRSIALVASPPSPRIRSIRHHRGEIEYSDAFEAATVSGVDKTSGACESRRTTRPPSGFPAIQTSSCRPGVRFPQWPRVKQQGKWTP